MIINKDLSIHGEVIRNITNDDGELVVKGNVTTDGSTTNTHVRGNVTGDIYDINEGTTIIANLEEVVMEGTRAKYLSGRWIHINTECNRGRMGI